jgi:hypothetical protein
MRFVSWRVVGIEAAKEESSYGLILDFSVALDICFVLTLYQMMSSSKNFWVFECAQR